MDGLRHTVEFAASSSALPIVNSPASTSLPTGCTASTVEFNTYTGWTVQNFNGFSIAERQEVGGRNYYLEVNWQYTQSNA